MIRHIPVIEINRENLSTFWPSIILCIRNSCFISLDAELSGLGDRSKLRAKSIDDRYKAIADAATSRSILSLGLCCFLENEETDARPAMTVQTYNFLTLCEDDFVVEPGAVRFLVDHGFDFNLQYAKGLPYHRGPDVQSCEPNSKSMTLRNLFREILSARKPIIFHNGVVDLIFMYGNLLADVPSTLQTFIADIADLFPSGVYDTKFIADFCARFTASYLEYVFRKCQRENEMESASGRPHIEICLPRFTSCAEKWVEWAAYSVKSTKKEAPDDLCPVFSAHGWCKEGRSCPLSHDVDVVLDLEDAKLEKKRAKRKRRLEANQNKSNGDNESLDPKPNGDKDQNVESDKANQEKSIPLYTGAHRAGYDAFMTAFSFAFLTLKLDQWPDAKPFNVDMFKNKIALSGKDYPLFIQRSAFSKPSQNVQEILKGLF